ncbi:lysophospholipid acyltransferase family protein [Gracilibacillus salinarum]|uniref:1-acyl-sn-glycerol-3-phosphate acyltransferase n=1 Tax=Gracilibacillus salinarum TaxID=2932255 RepID=A0ABY4GSI4_9BACI|nr:lysophospholipid acyltransferase family protein [Gracilibacillus salinarum]UOQ87357.1 1-acyl-sn-glycerol-3-phosphate acyltransferase [Gracilibacillus salinarum]
MSIEKKPSKWVKNFLLSSIHLYLRRTTTFKVTRNDTKDIQPPYLIVSNHVNNWDPLYINLFVDEPISFIAGEPLFRKPLLKRVLDYTGAIRKTKFKNDTSTIRNAIKAKNHGRVIGLFPEGNRNWDGVTEPVIYSTAKLVKLLKIPVVAAKIKGGYLTHPRWGDGDRKGTIEISYQKIWDTEEVSNLSVAEIHQTLTTSLYHDEMEWQKEKGYRFRGKHNAHYLERLLFVCPACESVGSMHSDHDTFSCTSCHYQVTYTEQGFFAGESSRFDTPHQWSDWQLQALNQIILDPPQMEDIVTLYRSIDQKPFEKLLEGTIHLKENTITFAAEDGARQTFFLDDMEAVNIHFHHKLSFFHDDHLYEVIFTSPRSSCYQWLQMIQRLQQNLLEKEQTS